MCITLPAAAGLAGAGISAIGGIASGNQQAATANYEGQVARNNEVTAYQNANYATAAGETRSYDQGLKERATAGAIRSSLAAGGVDVNTGSAAQVQESQSVIGLTDVEQVRQQAEMAAYGYKTQATNFGAQAQLDTQEAGYDEEAGWLNGLGSLLTGGAKFGGGFSSGQDTTGEGDYSGGGFV